MNRIVNGSRDEDRRRSGRSGRSRSRSRSGRSTLKDIAAGGVAAGVAKKVLDHDRSRSRSRSDRHRRHSSSSDSGRSHRRSRSVSGYIDKGMSKLGFGEREKGGRPRERDRDRRSDDSGSGGDSDFSLSEEERKYRKLRGKELVTAGLATVATVHAAHEIYENMEKRKKRLAAVKDGTLDPEKAKKMKRVALLKDAANLGLVGLGVKGTVDNWKEMNEQRVELRQFSEQLKKHRQIMQERRGQQDGEGGRRGGGGGGDRNGRRSGSVRERGRRSSVSGPIYQDGNPYAAGGS